MNPLVSKCRRCRVFKKCNGLEVPHRSCRCGKWDLRRRVLSRTDSKRTLRKRCCTRGMCYNATADSACEPVIEVAMAKICETCGLVPRGSCDRNCCGHYDAECLMAAISALRECPALRARKEHISELENTIVEGGAMEVGLLEDEDEEDSRPTPAKRTKKICPASVVDAVLDLSKIDTTASFQITFPPDPIWALLDDGLDECGIHDRGEEETAQSCSITTPDHSPTHC